MLLKSVSRGDAYYLKARVATASIHLNHRNNKKLYIRAYTPLPPAPCTLHPVPCTLHSAPCTLHPKHQTLNTRP